MESDQDDGSMSGPIGLKNKEIPPLPHFTLINTIQNLSHKN